MDISNSGIIGLGTAPLPVKLTLEEIEAPADQCLPADLPRRL